MMEWVIKKRGIRFLPSKFTLTTLRSMSFHYNGANIITPYLTSVVTNQLYLLTGQNT
jgi:hypothetical protein